MVWTLKADHLWAYPRMINRAPSWGEIVPNLLPITHKRIWYLIPFSTIFPLQVSASITVTSQHKYVQLDNPSRMHSQSRDWNFAKISFQKRDQVRWRVQEKNNHPLQSKPHIVSKMTHDFEAEITIGCHSYLHPALTPSYPPILQPHDIFQKIHLSPPAFHHFPPLSPKSWNSELVIPIRSLSYHQMLTFCCVNWLRGFSKSRIRGLGRFIKVDIYFRYFMTAIAEF